MKGLKEALPLKIYVKLLECYNYNHQKFVLTDDIFALISCLSAKTETIEYAKNIYMELGM